MVGAIAPSSLVARLGIGRTLALSLIVIALGDIALPLSGERIWLVALAVGFGQFFFGLGLTVFRVAQVSLRQALVAGEIMGRVTATLNVLAWGLAPIGALVGGILGQALGLRTTLVLAALSEALVAVTVWRSPLWSIRAIPSNDDLADPLCP